MIETHLGSAVGCRRRQIAKTSLPKIGGQVASEVTARASQRRARPRG